MIELFNQYNNTIINRFINGNVFNQKNKFNLKSSFIPLKTIFLCLQDFKKMIFILSQ